MIPRNKAERVVGKLFEFQAVSNLRESKRFPGKAVEVQEVSDQELGKSAHRHFDLRLIFVERHQVSVVTCRVAVFVQEVASSLIRS